MSGSTAIGMVSKSLRNLLKGEMKLAPEANVTVLAPDETGGERRINLFLYKVQEHAALRNLDWQVKMGDPSKLVPPPLSLTLFYLMTPYAKNDDESGNSSAHEILGEAMRVFFEYPIVPEKYLDKGLKSAREQIKIVLNSLDLEELSKVWTTFTQPFRLSVLYEVSTVQLDTKPEKEPELPRRVRIVGTPVVRAPYRPPEVDRITPERGPAGTELTVSGSNLASWKAYVTILNRRVVEKLELDEDSFTFKLPADLTKGFHEIKVDISHLFRKTFFFEVT